MLSAPPASGKAGVCRIDYMDLDSCRNGVDFLYVQISVLSDGF